MGAPVLTQDQVDEILELREAGVRAVDVARRFGVSGDAILYHTTKAGVGKLLNRKRSKPSCAMASRSSRSPPRRTRRCRSCACRGCRSPRSAAAWAASTTASATASTAWLSKQNSRETDMSFKKLTTPVSPACAISPAGCARHTPTSPTPVPNNHRRAGQRADLGADAGALRRPTWQRPPPRPRPPTSARAGARPPLPPALLRRRQPSCQQADTVAVKLVQMFDDAMAKAPKSRRAKMVASFQQEPTKLADLISIPVGDLERETEEAVAALEIEPSVVDTGGAFAGDAEVVRALADIDVLTIADFDLAALENIDLQPGERFEFRTALERCKDMNAEHVGPISEKIYLLDENTADGSAMLVIASDEAHQLMDRLIPDEATRTRELSEFDLGQLKAILSNEKAANDTLAGQLENTKRLLDESDQKVLRLERLADPTRFAEPVVIVGAHNGKGDVEIRVTEDLPRYRTDGCTVIRLARGNYSFPSLSCHNARRLGELLLGKEYQDLQSKGYRYDNLQLEIYEARSEIGELKSKVTALTLANTNAADRIDELTSRGFWARLFNRGA